MKESRIVGFPLWPAAPLDYDSGMAAIDDARVSDATPPPWYDRLSDWFNAILIKESRQALKSRQFVAVFMLLLAIAWVVSVFGLLNSGAALEFGAVGRDFFYYFYVVLAFAAIIIVPFSAFRSLLSERDLNTYDLLIITSLKPRQIVWGKLLSSGLQLFLFYSAITPFMAFASLLQGFNTGTAAVLLVGTLLLSLLLSMAALMLSTFARLRVLQGLLSAGALVGLVSTFFWVNGLTFMVLRLDLIALTDSRFWLGMGFALVAAASYFVLFQQIAVSQLTFESDNRSTGVRVVCVVQFWLVWVGYALYEALISTRPSSTVLAAVAGFCVLHWAVAGFVFGTEGDFLSRRVRREIPRNRLLRLLKAPFLPGGARGYLLTLGHLLALWLVVAVCHSFDGLRPASLSQRDYFLELANLQSPVWGRTLRLSTALCFYAVIYLGIATALTRWGMAISGEVRPAHIRVLTILLFLAGVIFPLILRATDVIDRFGYTAFDITSPKVTCDYLMGRAPTALVGFDWSAPFESMKTLVQRRGYYDVILVLLGVAAALAVLVNVPALYRGLSDLHPLRPRRHNEPE